MRYAGPKEAILHGIMRKNYGCTHIIIGRDHAGVGKYYGEEEAIEKFEAMAGELEIQPITIRGDFWYCCTCGRVASNRTCPHEGETCLSFSGTEIRAMIQAGTPHAGDHALRGLRVILESGDRSCREARHQSHKEISMEKGIVIWFTASRVGQVNARQRGSGAP